jgi:hypothetical protein
LYPLPKEIEKLLPERPKWRWSALAVEELAAAIPANTARIIMKRFIVSHLVLS